MNKIIIHCSATKNGRRVTASEIHRWHQKERGWHGIGYHYVIRVDGVLEAGRPEYWAGAHVVGHNFKSIGICMIGTNRYSIDQWAILTRLLRKLIAKYPEVEIIGHNELSKKKCPGFNVQQWLAEKFYKDRVDD